MLNNILLSKRPNHLIYSHRDAPIHKQKKAAQRTALRKTTNLFQRRQIDLHIKIIVDQFISEAFEKTT